MSILSYDPQEWSYLLDKHTQDEDWEWRLNFVKKLHLAQERREQLRAMLKAAGK